MATNQYIVINPNTISIDEYVDFDKTFNISFAPPAGVTPPAYNYILHDVIFPTNLRSTSKIVYTRLGNMSFNLKGSFKDEFSRSIKFIDSNSERKVVTNVSQLPAGYLSLYAYTPASVVQNSFRFTVRMRLATMYVHDVNASNLDTYNLDFIVRNNWQVATEQFNTAVKNGAWAKTAVEQGYGV